MNRSRICMLVLLGFAAIAASLLFMPRSHAQVTPTIIQKGWLEGTVHNDDGSVAGMNFG